MNKLSVFGKYLDQPKLIKTFSSAVPAILTIGGATYTANEVRKAPRDQKYNTFIKNTAVLTGTIGSALLATRGLGQIKIGKKIIFKGFKGLSHHCHSHHHHHEDGDIIDKFIKHNKVSEQVGTILNKAKTKILKPSEIKTLFEELENNPNSKEFLSGKNGLIPNPENIDSKHIFEEIKRLSVMGFIPVVGGISGGVIGDKLTDKNWKEKIPNKIKEGSYQYLANIFLCNVGAGIALYLMEKAKVTSKAWRATGMITGIILAGIGFGSAVANLIGKKLIDPMFEHKHNHSHGKNKTNLYSERKPEAIDVGLHIDDVTTVAVLSGLKWIEPALPILYSISGYRAGIGYRNNN